MNRLARWTEKGRAATTALASLSPDPWHTVAYVLVALLTLGVAVSLPFALTGLIGDLQRGDDRLSFATTSSADQPAAIRLHLDFTSVDVGNGAVSVRVTAALDCAPTCPDRARVDLFSTLDGTGSRLPVIEMLEFSPDPATVSKVISLPIRGEAIRYPFDRWVIRFNAVPLRVLADGSKQRLAIDDPAGRLALTVENRISRMRMSGQSFTGAQPEGEAPAVALGAALDFERPLYLRIVTVLLVVLVGAASAYAIFLRPLSELIINAGALVLGVWGIRAVLLGTELTFMTAVDLALMGVILFLLVMLTARTLWALEARSQVRPLRDLARIWERRR